MAKADVVAAQLAAIQSAETAAITAGLGSCYDQGAVDGAASAPGGFNQSDLDNAVAVAVAPLNAQITQLQAQDQTDAANASAAQASLATANASIATLTQQLSDMTAQDNADKALVTNLQGAVASVQSALDAIKSALGLAPASAPSSN